MGILEMWKYIIVDPNSTIPTLHLQNNSSRITVRSPVIIGHYWNNDLKITFPFEEVPTSRTHASALCAMCTVDFGPKIDGAGWGGGTETSYRLRYLSYLKSRVHSFRKESTSEIVAQCVNLKNYSSRFSSLSKVRICKKKNRIYERFYFSVKFLDYFMSSLWKVFENRR